MSNPDLNESLVREEDLRAVTRLLGDVAGLDAPLEIKRRRLCEGMSELVDADGWLWAAGHVDEQDAPMSVGHMYGGLTRRQVAALLDEVADNEYPNPSNPHIADLIAQGRHFTRTRQQLVSDAQWYSSRSVKIYRLGRDVEIDNCMYSIVPQDADAFCGVGFFRFVGREAFTERQRCIAHIVTSEVAWLCDTSLPARYADILPNLPPRLRTVLTLLIDGCNCEEIAEVICLSPHTVKGYMKELYRRFDAHSQPKLMRMFRE